ncbi:MAG: fatty acid desaturase [Verrucomicrobiae bacterium]|nr:fatty acid desaturase [Verrucomicrobiae bacterium]NNJ87307.1 acyl-CoA desaturase [Akkermansiaceae bacterium]
MLKIPFHRVNWITSVFLIVTALIAVIGVPIYLVKFGIDWFQAGMFFFYATATTMSITLGYHRLFSHLAFKAKWPVKFTTLLFGACAFENSCLDWSSDHRRHHKHCDHDDDPYDISKGFMWAHIGWLMFKLKPEPPMDNVADLKKDKLVMLQHKYVHWIGVLFGLALPAAIAYMVVPTWQYALGGFLLSGVLRVVVVQHCTFFINSLCHTIGRQPYNTENSARDSAIMAVFTCGEGYHNYHHAFQHDYRNGVKPWQFDPTKWMIWLLSKIGLASGLRRVPDEKILLAEMREARRQAERIAAMEPETPLCEKAMEAYHSFSRRLSKSYAELEQAMSDKVEVSRQAMDQWQKETREFVRHISAMHRQAKATA